MILEQIRQEVHKFPEGPGVYLMKDAHGVILYAGKAASLRKRVSSYFQQSRHHTPAIDRMVPQVDHVEFIQTVSEAEALILEASIIKKYQPRYNVDLKDDKSYPYLKLTLNEKFPRLLLTREALDDGARYFGPYTDVKLLRQALSFMRRTFPLRTCKTLPKRACLQHDIGQCVAPCVGKADELEYQRVVDQAVLFLEGRKDQLVQEISRGMKAYAERQEYELAAGARDQLRALTTTLKQSTPREIASLFASDVSPGKYHRTGIYRVDELLELKEIVQMSRIPRRIEAFDVSNISGMEAVASLVSFLNGEPDKSQYKRFKIRFFRGPDDYRMMKEVILRRYERVLKEQQAPPDLILVDGGKGQVSVAKEALNHLGLGQIPLIGLAKRLERIAFPGVTEYIPLSENSKARLLLQRIRDEAHRFAIRYHRRLRQKRLSRSSLDQIPGIGPKRKRALLSRFDSVEALRSVSIEELAKLPGFSLPLAKKLKERLKTEGFHRKLDL
ncbi:MAG: excinuclease ABC subunit UvrC [Candidatus Omnitrophica bacterium]|nr:excinuclease ABC subunit UvrC [Candidatus Omnitrophota bacterium]